MSFSDIYGPARAYLRRRFPEARVAHDFRLQARLMLQRGLIAINNNKRNL